MSLNDVWVVQIATLLLQNSMAGSDFMLDITKEIHLQSAITNIPEEELIQLIKDKVELAHKNTVTILNTLTIGVTETLISPQKSLPI